MSICIRYKIHNYVVQIETVCQHAVNEDDDNTPSIILKSPLNVARDKVPPPPLQSPHTPVYNNTVSHTYPCDNTGITIPVYLLVFRNITNKQR